MIFRFDSVAIDFGGKLERLLDLWEEWVGAIRLGLDGEAAVFERNRDFFAFETWEVEAEAEGRICFVAVGLDRRLRIWDSKVAQSLREEMIESSEETVGEFLVVFHNLGCWLTTSFYGRKCAVGLVAGKIEVSRV